MTIVEFLLARVAEDEEVARGVVADDMDGSLPGGLTIARTAWSPTGVAVMPQRVLAECEAKRRIASTMQTAIDQAWQDGDSRPIIEHLAHRAIRTLAAVYADHPDYDEAWRP